MIGPTLLQLGIGLVRRSIARTCLPAAENTIPTLHSTAQDHVSTLDTTTKLLPSLMKYAPLQERSTPTLWHTDLHMGNIFVSQEDHTRIVGLIDWQSTSISPLFLQARWPVFLMPPEGYCEGAELPKLPANFEELDANEKEIALFEKDRATCAKAYEVATYLNNHDAYTARWDIPEQLRELFSRIGDTWDDGIIPLRTSLIQIYESWEQTAFPDHVLFTSLPQRSHLMNGSSLSILNGMRYKNSQRSISTQMLKVGCLQKQTGLKNDYRTRRSWNSQPSV